jgi:cyclophilin family peptidyl-prolyl cis-trans isomerase
MNNIIRKSLLIPVILLFYSCSTPRVSDSSIVLLKTSLGDIKIKLYDSTPLHRDNFLRLINAGFYDDLSFHRVIKGFMIQAGDPSTRGGVSKMFPDSLNTYTVPPEINSSLYHKRGALAAARKGNEENPEMRSSGTQFYIVQGTKYTDDELNQVELRVNSNIKQAYFDKIMSQTADSIRRSGKTATDSEIQAIASVKMFDFLTTLKPFKYSDEQRNVYKTAGGVPRLDGTYTVFGEVVEGLDVVDRIADATTGSNDKPLTEIRIIKAKIVRN